MAIRVSNLEVQSIKDTETNTDPFVAAASLIVDDINSKCNKSFDEVRLKQIELFLSAHFVGVIDPALISERFENSTNVYQVGSASLSGIMSDKYGQTANMLAEGCLTDFDKAPATVEFL